MDMSDTATIQPSGVTLMIKPVGALCNLDCTYCYYTPTKAMYDHHERRMSLQTLESVFAGYLPHADNRVTIAWQGGEPTLAGLDFFRKAIAFQKKYAKTNQRIANSLQTNGTLLNDEWCTFLREHQFLVGISIDGGEFFHDRYRRDHRDRPSYATVMDGLDLLRRHRVEHNILAVLNDHNVQYPQRIFRELLDMGERWMQFIPAIEWIEDDQHGPQLAPFSPTGKAYGKFLCEVFDLWFAHHRKHVSVRLFDVVLNQLVYQQSPLCIMSGSCHNQVTVEHNGDVFGCDHFVQRDWQLGHAGHATTRVALTVGATNAPGHNGAEGFGCSDDESIDEDWFGQLDGQRLGTFANRKQHLDDRCDTCKYQRFCYGGCPKHRPHRGDVPEPSVLCEGYRMFFDHTMDRMQWMADYIRKGMQPPRSGPPRRQPRQQQRRPIKRTRKRR